jgi:hypothetical protein
MKNRRSFQSNIPSARSYAASLLLAARLDLAAVANGDLNMNSSSPDTLDFLKSRLEILDCVHRIARGVDRLDRDAVLSGYHADAIDDHGTFVGSPAGFVDYFFDLHSRAHVTTSHVIANHVCEINGDVAHAETYYVFASTNVDAPKETLAGGRYVDRFERRDGRWAIAVRRCVPAWNMTPGAAVSVAMREAFAGVGPVARNQSDLSYSRPLTVPPERLGLRIPM